MSKVPVHQIIDTPIFSEESQIQSTKGPQYTFKVNPKANKHQIRDAVERLFPNVKVVRVNTMNYQGKTRRQIGLRSVGRRPSWKKAIVTLRDGDSIDLI